MESNILTRVGKSSFIIFPFIFFYNKRKFFFRPVFFFYFLLLFFIFYIFIYYLKISKLLFESAYRNTKIANRLCEFIQHSYHAKSLVTTQTLKLSGT